MQVLFTRVDPIPAYASAHPSSGSFLSGDTFATTSTSLMTNTRSHKSTVTQPHLIKTTLEDALLSGQHIDVSIAPHNIRFLLISDSSEQRAQQYDSDS